MINVTHWYDEANDRWNAVLVSVTTRTEQEMKDQLVAEFNRATGENRTAADFTFTSL